MKIKLLKNYNLSVKGDVLDVAKPIADLLIGRKVAELVKVKRNKKCSNTK